MEEETFLAKSTFTLWIRDVLIYSRLRKREKDLTLILVMLK